MLVDLTNSKSEFMKYVNKFDTKDFNIQRKIGHSIRVMNLSKKIAESLNLTQKEIEIATLIGLLHDIGRFEQFVTYKTFKDSQSVDHGDLGVEILNRDNYIRKYISSAEFDNTIKAAITSHNKFKIAENLKEKELLFSKIIRDADKLDILYQYVNVFWDNKEKEETENETIQEKDLVPFLEKTLIDRTKNKDDKRTNIIRMLTTLAFVFDINFPMTFKILKQEDYINDFLNKFNFKDLQTKVYIEEIRKIINKYICDNQ